ncbi:MAG: hypothetical protein HY659_12790 [Rhizobiales bacterium]|nr:hypothetical protein [Hyphomicrobiales bacterium]
MPGLVTIPVLDLRDGGPLRNACERPSSARALRDDCLAWFPRGSHRLLPVMDSLARHWLTRSRSPYVAEVASIAEALAFSGIWFLNGSYQWCCTALAREEEGVPWLVRTLDWPFPGLGRHVEVARMAGPAGEFWNVTWPGYVGVLTAMAPTRFAAAINQAPLWRRTRYPWLRPYDIAVNGLHTWWRMRHIPPDQLLRQVCEECATYAEAKSRLETTPIARPVIFTLAGCLPGERCVIERTEETFNTRLELTAAANNWLKPIEPWEARVGGALTLTCGYEEAAGNSRVRRETLEAWRGSFAHDRFAWVVPPMLTPYTRLAVEMCATRGLLRVIGFESESHMAPAQAVTALREIALAA